jgi:hypothetical protein
MTASTYLNKLSVFPILLMFGLLSISNIASSQRDTTKNWRLFPSQNDVSPTVGVHSNTFVIDTLDFNLPDGTVEIAGDEEINALNTSLSENPCIYGYTIQVAVSQQKSVIQDARYKMIKLHPKVALDAPYLEPNLYLYAGRFYDRNSAYEFKHQISGYFPNAIVIGPKKLDLPVIEMPIVPEEELVTPGN